MEQIHLTRLQYHLQEQQSRKPTTSWGPRAALARFKTGEAVSLSRVLAPCFQTRWFRFMHHCRGIKTQIQTLPSSPKAGRQQGCKGSRDADQAPTEQKGVQCKADKSANKDKQRRRNSSSFMDMHFWEENARYDCVSQKQQAPCSHWNQHLPVTARLEFPWRSTGLHTTWVFWQP